MTTISEADFIALARSEDCRANLNERTYAVSPVYVTYPISAKAFMEKKTFPTWRTDKAATNYIHAFEADPSVAFPIKYADLVTKPHLFSELKFDRVIDYLNKTRNVIAFHCRTCGVHVVKDGNHRLLQCAYFDLDPQIEVYEVESNDWTACKVDMKNFCECILGCAATS